MRCWMQLSAGRGPAECAWVVARLAHFLIPHARNFGCTAEVLESVEGPMADTCRSVLIAVSGDEGLAQFVGDWQGTVQWTGTSMFRPNHKRKNWFVSVTVFEPVDMHGVESGDIRVETMRSSGPGGQHANKTESAVRVTDRASGLSAVSQEERSQHLNRKLAFARLQKLIEDNTMKHQKQFEQSCWQQHNALERGNAVHEFVGKSFKLKK